MASLTWRLEHGQEALGPRHVLVLDEGAMSSDADMAKLLGAVEASGAKLIAVGDFRQLSSVGPGGALQALAARHPGHVWVLRDNLRQLDPAERLALEHLRHGNVRSAVGWYAEHGRVHPALGREAAMFQMVAAWADDVAEGRDALMLAYHRDAVEMLNRAGREVWEQLGKLSGPELEAPGGRRYRAGDRVVTLAPGPHRAWATSEKAIVSSVDPATQSLIARTDDGRQLHIGKDDIGADKLGYGFAMTAHRSQGATVGTTYALADGGGRELAYVTMSRARGESHVFVVANDLSSAAERLVWEWGRERRQSWAMDHKPEKSLAQLYAERARLAASLPPDRSGQLRTAEDDLARVDQDWRDLYDGAGRWASHPAGQAALAAREAAVEYQRAQERAEGPGLGPWSRHKAKRELRETGARFDRAQESWRHWGEPHARSLAAQRQGLDADVARLAHAQREREAVLERQPDILPRLAQLERDIGLQEQLETARHWQKLLEREQQRPLQREPGHRFDRGADLGIDL